MQENTAPATADTTNIALLPPTERAVIVLGSAKAEAHLKELVAQSAGILSVIDKDGREQAHRAAMGLRNARTAITSAGKKAREDATAFSKAVIDEEKRLIAISQPEEDRVFGLRDSYDAEQARIKAEAERKEAERKANIRAQIETIRGLVAASFRDDSTQLRETIADLASMEITEAIYAEFVAEAAEVKAQAMMGMNELLTKAVAAEEEAQRLEAERAELERQRAQAAAEEVERQRVAAETKRQLEEQQAAIAAARKAEEDKLKAEREAFERERAEFEAQKAAAAKAAEPVVESAAKELPPLIGEDSKRLAAEACATPSVLWDAFKGESAPAINLVTDAVAVTTGQPGAEAAVTTDYLSELTASSADDAELVQGFTLMVAGLYETRSADAIRELLESVLAELEGQKVAA